MLAPAPPPTYTLSPALRPLRADEVHALEDALGALTGDVGTALVTGVGHAMGRLVFDLATTRGPMLVMPAPEPAA